MAINEGTLTSMALCWRLERPDGAGIGLTSHDRPLAIGGLVYESAPGITPSAVVRSRGLESHSSDIAGALSSDALDETELALGRWNGATVNLSIFDWCEPQAAPIVLLDGQMGDVSVSGGTFSVELKGAAARLEGPVCPSTSAECRAQFGDRRCRVDLAGRAIVATVVSVDAQGIVIDRNVDERFLFGRIRYLDGANCGMTSVILAASGTVVRARDLARGAIQPGERIELREGCDKRLETCSGRFANAANFRGEPHLPGNDLLTRYPGA